MEENLQPSQTPEAPVYSSAPRRFFNKTTIMILAFFILLSFGSTAYILATGQKKASKENNAYNFVSNKSSKVTDITAPTTALAIPTAVTTATPKPFLISTPTPTPDPTSNWNVYNNANYGYSIKYPKDWTVKNQGQLEPKIPDYAVFNPATESANTVTISYSTRTYAEAATLGATLSTSVTVASVSGVRKEEKDSDGNVTIHVVLPIRTNKSLIFYAKNAFKDTFDKMLKTLKFTD